MSSYLPSWQRVGIKPNNFRSFDSTIYAINRSYLVAFPCEHMIFIYDRQTFQERMIITPDPTDIIIALTFVGEQHLYCCSSKGILYLYSIIKESNLLDFKDIKMVPSSITASLRNLFFISGNCIYLMPIKSSLCLSQPCLLTDTQSHLEVSVSPCGRAISSYIRGGPPPVLWFEPFEKLKRFVLPMASNVQDFQWGCTNHLTAVTASVDGIVRIWTESSSSHDMVCVSWYSFNRPVQSVAFCQPSEHWHHPNRFGRAVSKSQDVFPFTPRMPAFIIASLGDESFLLEQISKPKMRCLFSMKLPSIGVVCTICDTRYLFAENQIKRRLDISIFSMTHLSFYQIEYGNGDFLCHCPFSRPFISSTIKSIRQKNSQLVSYHNDGSVYNWYEERPLDNNEEMYNFNEKQIIVGSHYFELKKSLEYIQKVDFGFQSLIFEIWIESNNAMVIVSDGSIIISYISSGSEFRKIDVEALHDNISNISIHSTDLIAVSSPSDVKILFRNKNGFSLLSSRNFETPNVFFLRYTIPIVLVSTTNELGFYAILSDRIASPSEVPLYSWTFKPIPSRRINAISFFDDGSIFASTENSLFRVQVSSESFPSLYSPSRAYTVCTAYTLAYIPVLISIVNSRIPSQKDFSFSKLCDTSPFASNTHLLPLNLQKIISIIPQNWQDLDRYGQICLFSFILSFNVPQVRKCIGLFSIWGRLSKNQDQLAKMIQFKSLSDVYDSLLPYWIRENSVLQSSIVHFLSKSQPNSADIDEFLLLCIITGKKVLGKKIAAAFGQEKLASTIDASLSGQLSTRKTLLAAYRALREHRPALASLLFYVSNDFESCVGVLKYNFILSDLVSRLINVKRNDDSIHSVKSLLNGFYYHAISGELCDAINSLKTLVLEPCEILSINAHKCELLKAYNSFVLPMSLDIMESPYIAYSIINNHDSVAPSPSLEVIIHQELKKNSEQVISDDHDETSDDLNFDFGGGDIGDFDESDSSDYSNDPKIEPLFPDQNLHENNDFKIYPVTLGNSLIKLEMAIKGPELVSLSDYYLCFLMTKIFNNECNPTIVKILCDASKILIQNDMDVFKASMLLFSIEYTLSRVNFMVPLFENTFFVPSLAIMIEQTISHLNKSNMNSEMLNSIVGKSKQITDNDKHLFWFLLFDKMSCSLCKGPINYSPFLSSYHHRHRHLFSCLKNFKLSNPSIKSDVAPLLPNCIEKLKIMHDTRLTEHYRIAVSDPFISPFMPASGFSYSRTYVVSSKASSSVIDICINPQNNQNIIVAAKDIFDFHISQEDLKNDFNESAELDTADDWDVVNYKNNDLKTENVVDNNRTIFDSPFISKIPKYSYNNNEPLKSSRFFSHSWKLCSAKDSFSTLCCASHPTRENYVSGASDGRLFLWDYGNKIPKASAKYTEHGIRTLRFNHYGDRILFGTNNGHIFTSNFHEAQHVSYSPNSTATWLNTDTQVVAFQPNDSSIAVYDTLVGEKPILTIKAPQPEQKRSPIASYGSCLAIGMGGGRVYLYDIRMQKELSHLCLHEEAVKSLVFDDSGSFFVSGSKDNSISIIETKEFVQVGRIEGVLPNTNMQSKKHGVKTIAISNQVIVAGGYSSHLHVWTMSDPNSVVE